MRKKRLTAILAAVTMLAGTAQLVPATAASAAPYDYAKSLQLSVFFYESQQAGHLPEWNRVEWRGDSNVDDIVDGGWYDAGDHVKFNLPMSYSAAMLAWGLYEYADGIESCGEMTNYVNNLKWVMDYLAECDRGDSIIYQVGIGTIDHSWWGPAELYEYGMADQNKTGARDYLEAKSGISCVAGQMAAALAAGYAALQGRVDSATLEGYLKSAKNCYKIAAASPSDDVYNKSDAQGFYQSRQFYDDLFYAANWLYIATKDEAYLKEAESYIPNLGKELGQDVLKYSWCHCWDDVQQGATLLYAMNTDDAAWIAQAKRHLDYWLNEGKQADSGLRYVDSWGCLRYANTLGFLAAVGSDHLFKNDPNYDGYVEMYETQINYSLGSNALKQCYQVGFDENSPLNVHHRTAHGSWKNDLAIPDKNRHILYGALAGGPDTAGMYVDDRGNYINNEVATDYNAGFTALLCKMVSVYGGKSDPTFPPPETRDDEFFVEAKATHDSGGTTVSIRLTNHSAWPARVADNLSVRYYMDLSEIKAAGKNPEDLTIRCDRNQSEMYAGSGVKPATISRPVQYDGDIYYVEVTFPDGRAVLPVSEGAQQCEVLLALVCPEYGSYWDETNDYSMKGLGSKDCVKTEYIPVYENGVLIFGTEPDGSKGTGSISANEYKGAGSSEIVTTTKPITTAPSVTTTTTTTTTKVSDSTPSTDPSVLWGDASCDDSVDVSDAVLLARYIAEDAAAKISGQGKMNADVTHDNSLDTNDITKILKYVAKILTAEDLAKA
ncbi:MAG: glycoside hydrolase family 9 protein [Oscillospiraceae bacterium]|nr:glycoside hydrolase family 9 protein [Oscillospiraceae bacterium]